MVPSRMSRLPLRGVAAVAVLAALGGGACRRSPRGPGDTLRLAVKADVTGIFPNPPVGNEAYTIYVNRSVFEGLVRFDGALRVQPALAERWENPDDRTYLFFLRRGLRFSDGSPVTASDVVASLRATLGRHWITEDYVQAIETVRAVDERTVEIRTRGPYIVLLPRLPFAFVLPARAVTLPQVPSIGTGPYRVESWTPGRELRLVANEHWRGARPAFPHARFDVVEDDAARLGRVQRGEADLADHVPLEAVDGLRRDPRLRVVVQPTLRVLFLGLRIDRPPFSDPRVREALDLALDRRELIRRALGGRMPTATQLVPPEVVGHDPGLHGVGPDPARARALLAAAGFPKGLDVRLDGPRNRYVNDTQILAEVARQLGAVGVRVAVDAMDKTAFYDLIDSGRSSFYLLGWACESGDAGDALDSMMHSRTGTSLGTFNTFGLADPELDALIEASNRSLDMADRALRLQAALRRVAALRPVLPLVVQTEAVVLSRRIDWRPPVNLALEPAAMKAVE